MSLDIFLFGDKTITNLQDHLNRQVARSELVSSNLANVETPGYKARDLDFSTVLSRFSDTGNLRMSVTNSKHMGFNDGGEDVILVETESDSDRVDGNTVDLDDEMGKLAIVQLQYEAGLTALSRKLSLIRKAATNI